MEKLIKQIYKIFSSFQDLSLLMIRLILAYGFYEPAMKKINNFESIVNWFGEGLHLPFPLLNAILATSTEVIGVLLIFLGLMTRFISIPMMVIMVVAIITVHLPHGFHASDNGFEIPLYYSIMLFVLLSHGPGKYSLDEILFKKYFGAKEKEKKGT